MEFAFINGTAKSQFLEGWLCLFHVSWNSFLYEFSAHDYSMLPTYCPHLGWDSTLRFTTCPPINAVTSGVDVKMKQNLWNISVQTAVKSDEPDCRWCLLSFPLSICLNHSCLYRADKASVKSQRCYNTFCHQPWQLPWFKKKKLTCEIISLV